MKFNQTPQWVSAEESLLEREREAIMSSLPDEVRKEGRDEAHVRNLLNYYFFFFQKIDFIKDFNKSFVQIFPVFCSSTLGKLCTGKLYTDKLHTGRPHRQATHRRSMRIPRKLIRNQIEQKCFACWIAASFQFSNATSLPFWAMLEWQPESTSLIE